MQSPLSSAIEEEKANQEMSDRPATGFSDSQVQQFVTTLQQSTIKD